MDPRHDFYQHPPVSLFCGAIQDPQCDLGKTLHFRACLQGSKKSAKPFPKLLKNTKNEPGILNSAENKKHFKGSSANKASKGARPQQHQCPEFTSAVAACVSPSQRAAPHGKFPLGLTCHTARSFCDNQQQRKLIRQAAVPGLKGDIFLTHTTMNFEHDQSNEVFNLDLEQLKNLR